MRMPGRGQKGREGSPAECLADEIARVLSRPAHSGNVSAGELLESGREVARVWRDHSHVQHHFMIVPVPKMAQKQKDIPVH